MVTAMLSPVAGGLIRTWTDRGSQLWSVTDPDGLSGILGRGKVGRTPMPDNRFSLPGAATFAADAIETWGAQPWDVALTYGKLGG